MNLSQKISIISLFLLTTLGCGLGGRFTVSSEPLTAITPTAMETFTPTPLLDELAAITTPTNTPLPTDTPPTPTEPAPTDTPISAPRLSVSQIVNIRSGPGTAYTRLGQLNPGDSADILARNDNSTWMYIGYAGGEGWIIAELTRIEGDLNNVALKQADAPPPPPPVVATSTSVPPAAPVATPVPAGPQYAFKLANMFGEKNQGITQIRGNIKDANGQPMNGLRVRVRSGSFCTISYPSGKPGTYPAGNYDIMLRPGASDGVWLVAIVDKPSDPNNNQCDPGAQQLSEEVAATTNTTDGVVYVEFKKN